MDKLKLLFKHIDNAKYPQFALFLGFLLGLVVMFGWVADEPRLIQIQQNLVPMQFNAALSLSLLAIAALMMQRFRRLSCIISKVVTLIAVLTLLQYTTGWYLYIDELFTSAHITTLTQYPGRMAPNTALCYLLLSLSIIFYGKPLFKNINYWLSVFLALIVFAISLLSGFGYLSGLPEAYGFRGVTYMSIHTTLGMFLLSSALIKLNDYKLSKRNAYSLNYSIIGFLLLSVTFFTLLSIAIYNAQHSYQVHKKQEVIHKFKQYFENKFVLAIYEAKYFLYNSEYPLVDKIKMSRYVLAISSHSKDRYFTTQTIKKSEGEELIKRCKNMMQTRKRNLSSSLWSTYKFDDLVCISTYSDNYIILNLDLLRQSTLNMLGLDTKSVQYLDAFIDKDNNAQILNKKMTVFSVDIKNTKLYFSLDNKAILPPVFILAVPYIVIVLCFITIISLVISYFVFLQYRTLKGSNSHFIHQQSNLDDTKLQKKVKHMKLALDLSMNAFGNKSFTKIIKTSIDRVCDVLWWDFAHFQLIDDEHFGEYLDKHIWHVGEMEGAKGFIEKTESLNDASIEELLEHLRLTKQVVWIEYLEDEKSFNRRICCKQPLSSAVIIPIMLGTKIIALIELFSFKKRKEEADELIILDLIANQLSSVFEKFKVKRDMSEIRHFDAVTNLPNREYFLMMLSNAIDKAKQSDSSLALLYIDLDDFKKVNDMYGHEAGDIILKIVADKLKFHLNDHHIVARSGGDEFAIIVENIDETHELGFLAKKILHDFSEGIQIRGKLIDISFSIGISVFPHGAKTQAEMLKSAELALYKAKELGKNQYLFFSDDLNEAHKRRVSLETGLRNAIERNELSLCYQPQIDPHQNKIIGFEALLRWNSKELGEVSPYEFIPIAEDIGIISKIGRWVLEKVCLQMNELQGIFKKYGINPKVSVNVSVMQLRDKAFRKILRGVLQMYHCSSNKLTIEITETSLMDNISEHQVILRQLSDLGVVLSIDDFGTGYSSLNYLSSLPFSELKIDKSFIQDVENNENAQSIIKTVLQLAETMKLGVVAEGVETKLQLDFILKVTSTLDIKQLSIQGYYFSKPLQVKDIEAYISNQG